MKCFTPNTVLQRSAHVQVFGLDVPIFLLGRLSQFVVAPATLRAVPSSVTPFIAIRKTASLPGQS